MSEKQKLFGNVGGNQFRLIKEGVEYNSDKPQGHEQVREGLKKVFANGGNEISYNRLQNVGIGYIKNVTDAAKCALREARELAETFGYKDDQNNAKFIKEDGEMSGYGSGNAKNEPRHSENDMSNPEESTEVKIGQEILDYISVIYTNNPQLNHDTDENDIQVNLKKIESAARRLLTMHGQQ